MSEQLRESLSALMDGEASAFEVRRVLDEMRRDAELRKAWDRWQRVSAVLQTGTAPRATGLADRVWAELDDAPDAAWTAEPASSGHRRDRWRWTAWAAASAAVVGAAATFYFATLDGDGGVLALPEVAVHPADLEPPGTLPDRLPAAVRNVDAYLLEHMQQKAVNQPDVGAFAKLVTFESE